MKHPNATPSPSLGIEGTNLSATWPRSTNTAHTLAMAYLTVLPRLLSIALRRYTTTPQERSCSARMLMLNAARLAIHHLGAREAAKLFLVAMKDAGGEG